MSGIAGIIKLDGRPVEKRLIREMTDHMAFRGPDETAIRVEGCMAMGHVMMRSTIESETDHQPCSLDNRFWITADARLDDRSIFIKKLGDRELFRQKAATDAQLILLAYRLWGEDLVQHLLGDFAFAIWDDHRKCLFCVRDHFGVKPFYYVYTADAFIFSNTLAAIRCHPAVSARLNEQAVSDFLLCGYNFNLESTVFNDISRLAPAHMLTVSLQNAFSCRRYWSLPVPKIIRYRRDHDYIEQFQVLLNQAVKDRLRTPRIAVLMSGGLDSTSVAATAAATLQKSFPNAEMHAFNYTCDHLIPDEERHYAHTAAKALGISISHIANDPDRTGENWLRNLARTPEPLGAAMIAGSNRQTRRIGAAFRVGLTGQGGDPAFHPSPASLKNIFKNLLTKPFGIDIFKYIWAQGRLPQMGIRTLLGQRLNKEKKRLQAQYPPWLERKLSARLNLPDRWHILTGGKAPVDSVRSQAYRYITTPIWPNLFENYDPGVTHFNTELRHPFFDLRLLAFLLALPPVPWCIDKHLLREALRPYLPESILNRPKTPLSGFPTYVRLQQMDVPYLDSLFSVQELDTFVDIALLKKMVYNKDKLRPDESEMVMRPLGLALWLQKLQNSNMEKQ